MIAIDMEWPPCVRGAFGGQRRFQFGGAGLGGGQFPLQKLVLSFCVEGSPCGRIALGLGRFGTVEDVAALVAFLGVILLGPFAPLLALVKPSGKRCPYCRSVIDRAATVCPKCAREQPASEQQR
jgi:hypothetical protein